MNKITTKKKAQTGPRNESASELKKYRNRSRKLNSSTDLLL
jgi:hypothetical protein